MFSVANDSLRLVSVSDEIPTLFTSVAFHIADYESKKTSNILDNIYSFQVWWSRQDDQFGKTEEVSAADVSD